jgi:hypothetical protein
MTIAAIAPALAPEEASAALAERAFEALVGSLELATMHVGDRLGLSARSPRVR